MVRTLSYDKNGLKKGSWTPEEDRKLIAYVTRYGSWNWRKLPSFAGLDRCGKSCRLRWLNYLKPNLKRENYTEQEEEIIIRLQEKLGNKWSVIAAHLPGRTDNGIKNHWHTNLKKRSGKKDAVQTNENDKATKSNSFGSKQDSDSIQNNNNLIHISSPTTSKASDTAGSLTTQLSSILDVCLEDVHENISTESYVAKENVNGEFHGSDDSGFMNSWALSESPLLSCTENFVVENDFGFIEETSASFWTETYLADMSLFPNEMLAPLVNQSEEYIPSVSEYDADLWNLTNFHDLHVTSNPLW